MGDDSLSSYLNFLEERIPIAYQLVLAHYRIGGSKNEVTQKIGWELKMFENNSGIIKPSLVKERTKIIQKHGYGTRLFKWMREMSKRGLIKINDTHK